jgi:hypothetical protein
MLLFVNLNNKNPVNYITNPAENSVCFAAGKQMALSYIELNFV